MQQACAATGNRQLQGVGDLTAADAQQGGFIMIDLKMQLLVFGFDKIVDIDHTFSMFHIRSDSVRHLNNVAVTGFRRTINLGNQCR